MSETNKSEMKRYEPENPYNYTNEELAERKKALKDLEKDYPHLPFGWLEMVYDRHKSTDPEEVTKIINEKTWVGGSLAAFFDIDVDFERESFAAFVDFDFDFSIVHDAGGILRMDCPHVHVHLLLLLRLRGASFSRTCHYPSIALRRSHF